MTAIASTPFPGTRRKRVLVWLLVVVNTLAALNLVWQTQRYARLSRPADGNAIVRVTDVQLRDNQTVVLAYEADLDQLEAIEACNCHFSGATRDMHFGCNAPSTLPGILQREATWRLPPPFSRADAAKVVELVRRNWLGQDITLTDAGLKLLFGITNRDGDRYQGFLRLSVANLGAVSAPPGGVVLSAPARGLRVSSATGRKVFGLQFSADEPSLLTCEFILRQGDRGVCLPGLSAYVVTPVGTFNGSLRWFAPLPRKEESAIWELRFFDTWSNSENLAGELTLPGLESFDWRHESPLAPTQLVAGEVREIPLFRANTASGQLMEALVRVQRAELPTELRHRYPHGGCLNALPTDDTAPALRKPLEQPKRKLPPIKDHEVGA